MKYSLMVFTLFLSSVVLAGKPEAGAVYVGHDSFKNGACRVEVKNIEKSFLVDDIHTVVSIEGMQDQEVGFGMYDITNGSYANGQYEFNMHGRYYQAYYSLKVSENKQTAKLELSLIDGAFSNGFSYVRCNDLKLESQHSE